jgi:hypothetical protein
MLKKEGLDLITFASSIRLKKRSDAMGLNDDKLGSLMENASIHCFKRKLKTCELISTS